MLHLRVVCSETVAGNVVDVLRGQPGVVAITTTADTTHGDIVSAYVARDAADTVLTELRASGLGTGGLIALESVDATFGELAEQAVLEAPGPGADAVIWDELYEHIDEDATLTRSYLAFMALATLLAAIGILTDSTVTLVGGMVVGPEFGPLAGLAIALLHRHLARARAALLTLLLGFAVAIVAVALATLAARGVGLVHRSDLSGMRETEYIYHPGWLSLLTAPLAGAAGMLALSSRKSAALIGVFVSVTTVPAAGNAAVAGVLGNWHDSLQSLAQLGINLACIIAAAAATLAAMHALPRNGRSPLPWRSRPRRA